MRLSAQLTRQPSLVHRLALALVWLAVASSAIVFTEPAPTDVLTLGVIFVLPIIGLVAFPGPLLLITGLWLLVCGFGFLAALAASDIGEASKHMAISLYLALASVAYAGFVIRKPRDHARLLLNAHLAGALVAAILGLIGYFGLIPGASELFTKFDRASGPFKDPNVFGPFIVPAVVYALHLWLGRSVLKSFWSALALAILSLALLISFSRGAWGAAALAIVVYLYLRFVTSPRNLDRFRIVALGFAGALALLVVAAAALQIDSVERLFVERAALTQTYDVGSEGRFGGQWKAAVQLSEKPFGIGALEFTRSHHHEDVHNVYLSMFLNAGWVGGILFLALMAGTLVLGARHALRPTRTQGLFLVAYASLVGMVLLGAIIDTDHWRHLYLLAGLNWGLMIGDQRIARSVRIRADRRHVLLHPVIVLPPTRRKARILRPSAQVIDLAARRRRARLPGTFSRPPRLIGPRRPSRPARIVAPLQLRALPGSAPK
ncbi:MAG: O-antigen ligase family protein [Hyphomicrobiaceae bacterium]